MKVWIRIFIAICLLFLFTVPAHAQTVFKQNQILKPVTAGVVMSTSSTGTSTLFASTSPMVGSITATSTTATSSFTSIFGTFLFLNGNMGFTNATGSNLALTGSASTSALTISGGFFQQSLADCSNTVTSKVIYTLSTGKFSCATDQTGGTGTATDTPWQMIPAGVRLTTSTNQVLIGGSATATNATLEVQGRIAATSITASSSGPTANYGTIWGGLITATSGFIGNLTGNVTGSSSGPTANFGQIWGGTITATSGFVGNLTGNVTGNLTGSSSGPAVNAGIGTFGTLTATSGTSTLIGLTAANILSNGNISGVGATFSATTTTAGLNVSVFASTTQLYVTRGFFQESFGDCDTAATSKVIYDITTGKFTCGTDQNTGGTTTNPFLYISPGFVRQNTSTDQVLFGAGATTSRGQVEIIAQGTNPALVASGFVGIGTTTPYAKLSVTGQIVGEYFTSTSTTATNTFPILNATRASTTDLFVGTSGGAGDASAIFGPASNEWAIGYKSSTKAFVMSSSTALGTNEFVTLLKTGYVGLSSSTPKTEFAVVSSDGTTATTTVSVGQGGQKSCFALRDSSGVAYYAYIKAGSWVINTTACESGI